MKKTITTNERGFKEVKLYCECLADWIDEEGTACRAAMINRARANMLKRVDSNKQIYSLPAAVDTELWQDADARAEIDAEMVIEMMNNNAARVYEERAIALHGRAVLTRREWASRAALNIIKDNACRAAYRAAFRAILKVWREYSTGQAVGTPDPLNIAAPARLYDSPEKAAELNDLFEVGAQGNARRRAVLELTAAGYSQEDIAAAYGVHQAQVSRELTAARAALAADAANDQARAARADFAEQRAALAARWMFGTERGNKPARRALAAVWREWYKRGECPTDCATSPAPRATLDALTADRAPLEFGMMMDAARRAGTRQAAFALLIIGGYTPEQAAAELGTSRATAYRDLERVRQALAAAGYTTK